MVNIGNFGVEHLSIEAKIFVNNGKNEIVANIYKLEAYDSIMCDYSCIGFVNHMK